MRAIVLSAVTILFVAVVVRIEFGLAIVLLLALVLVAGLVVPHQVAKHLEVERAFVNRAFFSERVPVVLTLRNRSALPAIWIEMWELLPLAISAAHASVKAVITIPARSEKQLRYEVVGRRRGYWLLGPTATTTGDLLGVSLRRARPHQAEYLIVYPKILPLPRLGLPTRSPLAEVPAPRSLQTDPARVFGVRDYQLGDPLRKVHWTASARMGDLLVKQTEPAVARDTMIYLDLNRRNYSPGRAITGPELAITVAASLAVHSIERERQGVGLTVHARDPLVGRRVEMILPAEANRAHLTQILEVLARFQADSETDFPAMLRRRAPQLPWGSTLAVITGSVNGRLAETLVYLKRSGFAVAAFLVQSGPGAGAPQLSAARIRTHRIDLEQDLSGL